MSIQSAMQAGVAGLNAQSRMFATISDNIANSSTVGYKRTTADFISQVVESRSKSTYAAGGVRTSIVHQIERTGTIRGSDRSTDLAIDGGGFFLVRGGTPATQANEAMLLTRVGTATLDGGGYLRLQNGYFLQGLPVDATGVPMTTAPQSIRLEQDASDPVPSTTVSFRTNLPAELGQTVGAAPLETTMSYVDELGFDRPLRFEWTPAAGGVPNTWNLKIYDVDTDDVTAVAPATGWDVSFDVATGRPAAPFGPFTIAGFNGMPLDVELDLTQFDYSYNPYFTTDGMAVSDFAGIEVGEDGMVYSIYENGSRRPQYRLAMGEVVNPSGLRPVDDNAYAVSVESGALVLRAPGEGTVGAIQAFALEGSNVDLAEELTSMIVTQRAYSANASIITTSDEMLEEVVRLKR
jgi:flagellar hook protein FlgE